MTKVGGNKVPEITGAEHISPEHTGDNISAKRAANYVWDGANWVRQSSSVTIDTTGLATSAKQDSLLAELQLKADLTETQPVSLASVPSHAVTNAGTFAVQVTSAPTTTVTGTVTETNSSAIKTAVETIDNIVSGTGANISQVGGTNIDTNSGSKSAGTQRVVLATDQPQLTNALKVDGSAVTQPVSGSVTTTETVPTTIYNGNKNVTTAGTRVTLASSTSCKSVTIKAKIANTGTIYVGDTSVSSSNGFALAAGETVSLDIANLNTVNLDASVSGEGVTFVGVS